MSYFAESGEETNHEYKSCNPDNLIDDVYGLKRHRTDASTTTGTYRKQKNPEGEANHEYKPSNPDNLIDDVYGLKRHRTDTSITGTYREQKNLEALTDSQSKGRKIIKRKSYRRVAFQILRYGLAFYLSCALIEGIYNRVENDDRNYWGTVIGVCLVYVVLKYPFKPSEEKDN